MKKILLLVCFMAAKNLFAQDIKRAFADMLFKQSPVEETAFPKEIKLSATSFSIWNTPFCPGCIVTTNRNTFRGPLRAKP